MARTTKRPRKAKGVEAAGCCGRVCDQRCWESSARETQFGRRVGTAGGVRLS